MGDLIIPKHFETEEDTTDQDQPKLKLMIGGKDGDWLSRMPVSTTFLCSFKPSPQNRFPIDGLEYEVVQKEPGNMVKLMDMTGKECWVISTNFCIVMELKTILYEVIEE